MREAAFPPSIDADERQRLRAIMAMWNYGAGVFPVEVRRRQILAKARVHLTSESAAWFETWLKEQT